MSSTVRTNGLTAFFMHVETSTSLTFLDVHCTFFSTLSKSLESNRKISNCKVLIMDISKYWNYCLRVFLRYSEVFICQAGLCRLCVLYNCTIFICVKVIMCSVEAVHICGSAPWNLIKYISLAKVKLGFHPAYFILSLNSSISVLQKSNVRYELN